MFKCIINRKLLLNDDSDLTLTYIKNVSKYDKKYLDALYEMYIDIRKETFLRSIVLKQ